MNINGKPYRTIWTSPDNSNIIQIIDQRALPHELIIEDIASVDEMARAIADMHVRGAGLIGASAAYGMYLATLEAASASNPDTALKQSYKKLKVSRPTAVNLTWALDRQMAAIRKTTDPQSAVETAHAKAIEIANEDAAFCKQIGVHGSSLIRDISERRNGKPVNILTHCNAGWLAFVDHGSATSPIYAAHDAGIPVHVWVDETRPRNQGAALTAWELGQHGVPHTVIVDNAGGHLMQHGMVDLVIVGSDRTTHTGDVANKIGTYLKALAAKDNDIPFYVALPSSTIDWSMQDGLSEIPIEERDPDEVRLVSGKFGDAIESVQITPDASRVANYAFDVTPARLVSGLITERGICQPTKSSIHSLFPEC